MCDALLCATYTHSLSVSLGRSRSLSVSFGLSFRNVAFVLRHRMRIRHQFCIQYSSSCFLSCSLLRRRRNRSVVLHCLIQIIYTFFCYSLVICCCLLKSVDFFVVYRLRKLIDVNVKSMIMLLLLRLLLLLFFFFMSSTPCVLILQLPVLCRKWYLPMFSHDLYFFSSLIWIIQQPHVKCSSRSARIFFFSHS